MGIGGRVDAEHSRFPHEPEQAGKDEGSDDERHQGREGAQIAPPLRLGLRLAGIIGTAARKAEQRDDGQRRHEQHRWYGGQRCRQADAEEENGSEQERCGRVEHGARRVHASEHVGPASPEVAVAHPGKGRAGHEGGHETAAFETGAC